MISSNRTITSQQQSANTNSMTNVADVNNGTRNVRRVNPSESARLSWLDTFCALLKRLFCLCWRPTRPTNADEQGSLPSLRTQSNETLSLPASTPTVIEGDDSGGFTSGRNNTVVSEDTTATTPPFDIAHNHSHPSRGEPSASSPQEYADESHDTGQQRETLRPSPSCGLKPLHMKKIGRARGGSASATDFNGVYQDKITGQRFYIKEPLVPEAARNEVLMAQMAREFGLNVPAIHLVKQNGRVFVVSEWVDGLRRPIRHELLTQIDQEQLALLYLVAALLGNLDIFSFGYSNTQINAEGELIAIDWGEAGEFGPPYGTQRKTRTYFGPVVHELDAMRIPEHPSMLDHTPANYSPNTVKVCRIATDIFQHLTEETIQSAAFRLQQTDYTKITRLIDRLGPENPDERNAIKQLFADRWENLCIRLHRT